MQLDPLAYKKQVYRKTGRIVIQNTKMFISHSSECEKSNLFQVLKIEIPQNTYDRIQQKLRKI